MKHFAMARRLLAFVLAAAICFGLVPWSVFAAETGEYTQVTAAEDFTTGQYVLVTDTGYAPTTLDGSWILAAQPVVAEGKVTDPAGAVWTLTVDGSSVKLTDSKGQSIAPKGGNNGGNVAQATVIDNNGAVAVAQPQGLTDELVAVITAAAVACMGNSNIRVTGIRKRTSRSEWSDAALRENVQPFRMGDWK